MDHSTLKQVCRWALLVFAALAGWPAPAAAASRQSLATKLAAYMQAAGGNSGAWVSDTDTGERLFAWDAGTRRTPASVEKLLTTSTALDRLGESSRLETVVFADGELIDGTLTGDLYIKGFGDPSFTG